MNKNLEEMDSLDIYENLDQLIANLVAQNKSDDEIIVTLTDKLSSEADLQNNVIRPQINTRVKTNDFVGENPVEPLNKEGSIADLTDLITNKLKDIRRSN